MKYLFCMLLLCTVKMYSQSTMTAEDKQIIHTEILRNTDSLAAQEAVYDFIKDSLLVNSKVLKPKKMKAIKSVLNADNITDMQKEEIFGIRDENYFTESKLKNVNWQQNAFADLKVALFTKSKYKKRKNAVNALYKADMLSLSRPVINKDRTYALIETMSNKKGRILSIYKNTDKGWMFYKDIVLS